MNGTFIAVVGPSGSGKGTLIAYVRETFPSLVFARSLVSRAPRPGDKANYLFTSADDFRARVERDEFIEWAQYSGNYYGTPKSEVLPALETGQNVLKELEVQGARHLLSVIPHERLTIIFIDGGGWEEVERRILERAPITPEELEKRKARYEDEMTFMAQADYVIKNKRGHLEEAKQEIECVLREVLH